MVSKNSTAPNVSYAAAYCAFAVRRITLINKKFLSIGESHGAAKWKPRKRDISTRRQIQRQGVADVTAKEVCLVRLW